MFDIMVMFDIIAGSNIIIIHLSTFQSNKLSNVEREKKRCVFVRLKKKLNLKQTFAKSIKESVNFARFHFQPA